jgi:S-adenosylmethionine:tRNA ribosyltransferase-isomerase
LKAVRTEDFDFVFPQELIALEPAPRGASRLVVVARQGVETTSTTSPARPREAASAPQPALDILHWGSIADLADLPNLPKGPKPGDALVLNDTRVLRARLRGQTPQGGRFEALLLKPVKTEPSAQALHPGQAPSQASSQTIWQAMVKPGKRFRPGDTLRFGESNHAVPSTLTATVLAVREDGTRELGFDIAPSEFFATLERVGEVPLPPYIEREARPEDAERYQSVFARHDGSVAAPTASLHLHQGLLDSLENQGVKIVTVTLHVGAGTFKPVEAENLADHVMHSETYALSAESAAALNAVKARGGRVFAVGTTASRVLETCATGPNQILVPGHGETQLFITPGYRWRCVDGLLTNFHWPKSTLFMLVASLLGLERAKAVYAEAMARRFRLFSYGDAMLIV